MMQNLKPNAELLLPQLYRLAQCSAFSHQIVLRETEATGAVWADGFSGVVVGGSVSQLTQQYIWKNMEKETRTKNRL